MFRKFNLFVWSRVLCRFAPYGATFFPYGLFGTFRLICSVSSVSLVDFAVAVYLADLIQVIDNWLGRYSQFGRFAWIDVFPWVNIVDLLRPVFWSGFLMVGSFDSVRRVDLVGVIHVVDWVGAIHSIDLLALFRSGPSGLFARFDSFGWCLISLIEFPYSVGSLMRMLWAILTIFLYGRFGPSKI